jgi:hypothetical protein
MSDKYLVLRRADVAAYLTPEWQKLLRQILDGINDCRQKQGKQVDTAFFVLGMNDKYARVALQAYIRAIASDPEVAENKVVQECLKAARDIHNTVSLASAPRLPD